jgi:hypothetical protein
MSAYETAIRETTDLAFLREEVLRQQAVKDLHLQLALEWRDIAVGYARLVKKPCSLPWTIAAFVYCSGLLLGLAFGKGWL